MAPSEQLSIYGGHSVPFERDNHTGCPIQRYRDASWCYLSDQTNWQWKSESYIHSARQCAIGNISSRSYGKH